MFQFFQLPSIGLCPIFMIFMRWMNSWGMVHLVKSSVVFVQYHDFQVLWCSMTLTRSLLRWDAATDRRCSKLTSYLLFSPSPSAKTFCIFDFLPIFFWLSPYFSSRHDFLFIHPYPPLDPSIFTVFLPFFSLSHIFLQCPSCFSFRNALRVVKASAPDYFSVAVAPSSRRPHARFWSCISV